MHLSKRIDRMAYIVRSDILDVDGLKDTDLKAVLDHWDRARTGRVGPPRPEFRLEELPATIIPCVTMIDFLGPPIDYYSRFFGSQMVEAAGQEMTGKRYFADEIQGYGFVNAKMFPIMIERRAPLLSRTRWVSVKELDMTTVTLRLPLSEDGGTVTGGVTANRYSWGHHD